MERKAFATVMQEVLDSIPEEFRDRIRNVAVLVEDFPPGHSSIRSGQPKKLLLGLFHGVPLLEEHRSGVLHRGGNSETNPAHCHSRVRALFRHGRRATERYLVPT
jgi:predicted Zn-dependent protease with MMP-like domain